MADIRERFEGVFFGTAIGDALGAPFEGLLPEEIALFGDIGGYVDLSTKPATAHAWRLPGLYTDDTQLTLLVADTLIRLGRFSPDLFCRSAVDLGRGVEDFYFGVLRGTGGNFRRSVELWRQGEAWNRSGTRSAGNGSAMRAAPIGLYYRENRGLLIRQTVELALCTHRNPTGILAAVAQALLVAWMTTRESESMNPSEALSALLHGLDSAIEILNVEYRPYLLEPATEADPFVAGLRRLPDWLDRPDAEVLEMLGRHADETSAQPTGRPTSGYAPGSVLLAIFTALTKAGTPDAALSWLVSLGGDTDTLAAMAGAVFGALHGPSVFPKDWRRELRNADAVLAYAHALHASASGATPMPTPSLLQMEYDLTALENREWRERFEPK